ncbi:hypothetical protein GQ671_02300 [Salinicoccus hispanicus]|uniref:Uncharacterized protein n=1 Tax=Salinicoccus hispanicus TaxID=157225 RepID=A0A6N8TXG5_9STAP|nr:hypothetical protein [Salinicoccus hispanicus]
MKIIRYINIAKSAAIVAFCLINLMRSSFLLNCGYRYAMQKLKIIIEIET